MECNVLLLSYKSTGDTAAPAHEPCSQQHHPQLSNVPRTAYTNIICHMKSHMCRMYLHRNTNKTAARQKISQEQIIWPIGI